MRPTVYHLNKLATKDYFVLHYQFPSNAIRSKLYPDYRQMNSIDKKKPVYFTQIFLSS